MTRRERIIVLLENYLDVLDGLRADSTWADGGPITMSSAWNHPSYRELERLRVVMRGHGDRAVRVAYSNLAKSYFWPSKRRVLQCPKCGATHDVWAKTHDKHGALHPLTTCGKHRPSVNLIPALVQQITGDPALVERAVNWLVEHWQGSDFIPEPVVCIAKLCDCQAPTCEWAENERKRRRDREAEELAA